MRHCRSYKPFRQLWQNRLNLPIEKSPSLCSHDVQLQRGDLAIHIMSWPLTIVMLLVGCLAHVGVAWLAPFEALGPLACGELMMALDVLALTAVQQLKILVPCSSETQNGREGLLQPCQSQFQIGCNGKRICSMTPPTTYCNPFMPPKVSMLQQPTIIHTLANCSLTLILSYAYFCNTPSPSNEALWFPLFAHPLTHPPTALTVAVKIQRHSIPWI